MSRPKVITITILTDNECFAGNEKPHEVSRVLTELAHDIKIAERVGFRYLRDANGNTIGVCKDAED